MAASIYSRTLQKAVELIGGRAKLCRHLHVPAADLQSWIEDKSIPPIGVFLKVVDLVLDETPAPPADSGGDDPAAPRDCSAAEGSSTTFY